MTMLKTILLGRSGILVKIVVGSIALLLLFSIFTLSDHPEKDTKRESQPLVKPKDSAILASIDPIKEVARRDKGHVPVPPAGNAVEERPILTGEKEPKPEEPHEIRNPKTQMCIDASTRPEDNNKPVWLWPCHRQGGSQYWMLSKEGEIRRDEACLDYAGINVILYPCHGSKGNQFWTYNLDTKRILHRNSNKCLAISSNNKKLLMEECSSEESRQSWKFEN